jgi:hypothetical protein
MGTGTRRVEKRKRGLIVLGGMLVDLVWVTLDSYHRCLNIASKRGKSTPVQRAETAVTGQ